MNTLKYDVSSAIQELEKICKARLSFIFFKLSLDHWIIHLEFFHARWNAIFGVDVWPFIVYLVTGSIKGFL